MKGKLFNPKQVTDGKHIEFANSQKHAFIKFYDNGYAKVFTGKRKTEDELNQIKKTKADYMRRCKTLTEINAKQLDIQQRGFNNGNHIDHIVPREYGYKNNIPVELIASLENLQILSKEDNIKKGNIITHKAKELLQKWGFAKVV